MTIPLRLEIAASDILEGGNWTAHFERTSFSSKPSLLSSHLPAESYGFISGQMERRQASEN